MREKALDNFLRIIKKNENIQDIPNSYFSGFPEMSDEELVAYYSKCLEADEYKQIWKWYNNLTDEQKRSLIAEGKSK